MFILMVYLITSISIYSMNSLSNEFWAHFHPWKCYWCDRGAMDRVWQMESGVGFYISPACGLLTSLTLQMWDHWQGHSRPVLKTHSSVQGREELACSTLIKILFAQKWAGPAGALWQGSHRAGNTLSPRKMTAILMFWAFQFIWKQNLVVHNIACMFHSGCCHTNKSDIDHRLQDADGSLSPSPLGMRENVKFSLNLIWPLKSVQSFI